MLICYHYGFTVNTVMGFGAQIIRLMYDDTAVQLDVWPYDVTNDYECNKNGIKIAEDSFFYQGHFRRFIRREILLKRLLAAGFKIIYSAEETGFAPFGGDDSPTIRVYAKKCLDY